MQPGMAATHAFNGPWMPDAIPVSDTSPYSGDARQYWMQAGSTGSQGVQGVAHNVHTLSAILTRTRRYPASATSSLLSAPSHIWVVIYILAAQT